MEALDILWKYQELDLLMDQYENERKNSSLRHKLIKLKNYLVEQQDYLVKLDDEAIRKYTVFNRIQHEYESILNALKAEQEKVLGEENKNSKQFEQFEKEGMTLKEKLAKKENELMRLISELEAFQKKLDDIRLQVNKVKAEYAEAKDAYDGEALQFQQKHKVTMAKRDELVDQIEKALMQKYDNLKSSRSPVIAVIQQDRCGGCNMSLASLVIQNVKDKKRVVECENCGRFLYFGA